MICRKLKREELPLILPLCHKFWETASIPGNFDDTFFLRVWNQLFEIGMGEVFVLEDQSSLVGMLGAVFSSDFSADSVLGREAFWFVFPEVRGHGRKLLDAYEEEGRLRKVSGLTMVHLEGGNAEALSRIYCRRGYRPFERVYLK